MADDQPMWGNNRAIAPTPGAAIIAVDLEDNFIVKGHHLSMIKYRQFDRHARAEPHKHIAEFVEICECSDMAQPMRTQSNSNSSHHPLPVMPKHGLGRGTVIQIFYHGLDEAIQAILDAGDIKEKPISKTFAFAESSNDSKLIEKMEALTTKIDLQFKDIKGEMKEIEDEANEAEKEPELIPSKQTKLDPPPLKAYKPKILYPQRLRKEKMEEQYAKFIDLIKEVRINVPPVDVLAGMQNYEKFLKDLVSNKSSVEYLALANLGASINLMPYSLYASLSGNTLKPTRMIGKFIFPADFVILQMEEDDKVPLILGRPFLHTADAIIRVKNKELNLGVGDDRITFLINKDMQHSHSNDDTCFRMDIINEVTEEELDALLDDSKPFLGTLKKINDSSLDHELEEFMAIKIEEIPEQ
ncbi:reverse transcriptase domain-containing protein [Tanacetum coccineum]